MEFLILSTLLLPQDVVIEMNDGVREVRVGKAAVRVEVRNAGEEGSSGSRPDPQQRWFHEEELESTRLEEAWD